jgi:RNA polymerase sigma-70 factor (sigma-E family)
MMQVAALERRGVPGVSTRVAASALSTLYDQHYRSLVKLASMYLDDLESAEEVVQDAFVKLLTGRYRVEVGKEASYLRSMVLNGARSLLRKRRVRRLNRPEPPGLVAAAEEGGVAQTEREHLLRLVRALPPKQAAVLILRYYLDLSESDIADTLGIAPGSVKSHAHRALSKLQAQLEGDR